MKRNKNMRRSYVCLTSVVSLLLTMPLVVRPHTPDKDSLKPEAIVAKHLAAIGNPELLGSITSYLIRGTVKYTFRSGISGQAAGDVIMASAGPKSLISMTFAGTDYPFERLAFDGGRVTTSYLRPGAHTPLGSFILMDEVGLKEGLLGGVLSTGWPLLKLSAKNAKLESGGTKKIGDRPVLVIKYKPRKGSDFSISLSFDAETFQHVRTDYERIVSAQIGSGIDNSAGTRSTRYRLTEQFSDFSKETGVTLPHVYKIQTAVDTPNGTQESEWTLTLTDFRFNQVIDAGYFKIS